MRYGSISVGRYKYYQSRKLDGQRAIVIVASSKIRMQVNMEQVTREHVPMWQLSLATSFLQDPATKSRLPLGFTIQCVATFYDYYILVIAEILRKQHHCRETMSFDRLPSLESQPTTTRRRDDPTYRDDPEFQRFTEDLSTRLFELVSNVSRLSNEIAKLGTSRDTERVRERVHDLLEETRDGFKEVGEGIKKAQAWEDLNVGRHDYIMASY